MASQPVLSPLSLGTVLDRTVQCQRTRGLPKEWKP